MSIWGDIQRRGMGIQKKKEDEVLEKESKNFDDLFKDNSNPMVWTGGKDYMDEAYYDKWKEYCDQWIHSDNRWKDYCEQWSCDDDVRLFNKW